MFGLPGSAEYHNAVARAHRRGDASASESATIADHGIMNSEFIGSVVSVGSLAISIASLFIARSSLKQAKQVAEQERRDWRQRKWFDLYFKANEVYDLLDRFQKNYGQLAPTLRGVANVQQDLSELMLLTRELHSMALVFPKNQPIQALFDATKFPNHHDAFLPARLQQLFDASEGLRKRALVDSSVLDES
jgi:hypothetical protein